MRKPGYFKLLFLFVVILIIVLLQSYRRDIGQKISEQVQGLAKLKWVCYAPTHFDPEQNIFPTIESMQKDLSLLKSIGFDGIITYECKGQFVNIPEIANEIGLKVILGIWAPKDKIELEHAVKKKDIIAAYCVGNEGLDVRYNLRDLDEGTIYLSNHTNRPVAISEKIHVYFQYPELVDMGDWIFPIVHPHFANAKSVDDAVGWIRENTRRLRQLSHQRNQFKTIFLKEIGMPSDGDPSYSEEKQAQFFDQMFRLDEIQFAVFEAFERTGWEYISPVEPYWGIFFQNRSPKKAAKDIRKIFEQR